MRILLAVILAQRQEEMQLLTDKLNLTKFLATQRELGGTGGMADDSVAQAAKRAFFFNYTCFFLFYTSLPGY